MIERLLIAALATWRICAILLTEEGFLGVGVRFRSVVQRLPALAALGYCIKCLSVWVGALATALLFSPAWVLLIPFALSGLAMVIYDVVDGRTQGR